MTHRILAFTAVLAAAASVVLGVGASASAAAISAVGGHELEVAVSLPSNAARAIDGRVYVLVAQRGKDPLAGISVDGTTSVFGKNVQDSSTGQVVTLSGGGGDDTDAGVYGYPYDSLDDLPPGDYTVRAFFNVYTTVTRSDGSTVQVHFPCGDGGVFWNTPGNYVGAMTDITVTGDAQRIALSLDQQIPTPDTSHEIGGCQQGNYADTDTVKHVKIRSAALSAFWGRDMYVGANIQLPPGYDASDTSTRYPVIYSQSHWPGDGTAFWGQQIDRFITVTIRQESPFYDDAYAVNSANVGPWGDAVNDELLPYIDAHFNTIAEPYARVQEGGSTGGWVSLASTLFRPDLYGSTWSYYPDSLDFHQHQQIDIYNPGNAYYGTDGTPLGSWREFDGDVEKVTVSMLDENHYELALGTNGRSFDQWDIWNAVYGPQGYNGYPLAPWDKVTGEIDPAVAQLWKPMDLTDYLAENWSSSKDLGAALAGRVHASVGSHDNYYLNGGVELFGQKVSELGGPDWADVTVIEGAGHGGYYDNLDLGTYLDQVYQWVQDHSPTGATPLSDAATAPSTRGNTFAEVIETGGAGAAAARQSAPTIVGAPASVVPGAALSATFGTWDPGVQVTGQWTIDGVPAGAALDATSSTPTYTVRSEDVGHTIAFAASGSKRGYADETRVSAAVLVSVDSGGLTPGGTSAPAASAPSLAATGEPATPILAGAVAVVMLGTVATLIGLRRGRRPRRA